MNLFSSGRKQSFTQRFVIVLVLAVSGWSTAFAQAPKSELLIVGSEQEYPPFSKGMTDSEAGGFTVELWRAVATASGLKSSIRVLPFSDVLEGFKNNKIDVMINLAQSAERKRFADFTVPHVIVRGAVFTRNDAAPITNEDQLLNLRVIVLAGDLAHDYAKQKWPHKTFVLVKNAGDGLQALADGAGDAMLISRVAGLNSLRLTGLKGIHALPVRVGFAQKFSFAVHKGNSELLAKINEGLDVVKATGQYDRIYEKWFGVYEDRGPDYRRIRAIAAWVVGATLILGLVALRRRSLERQASFIALQEAEIKFRSTFEQASVGIAHVTLDGKFLMVNDRLCQFLGYRREELLGMSFQQVSYYEELQENLDLMKSLAQKLIPSFVLEKRYVTKANDIVAARIFVSLVAETKDRDPYAVAVVEDISDMRRARKQLEENEARYRALMEFGAEAVFIASAEGKIIEVNQKAVKLMKVSREDLLKLRLIDLHPESEASRFGSAFKGILASGKGTLENVHINCEGVGDRLVDISGSYFVVGDQPVFQAVYRDVTDRNLAAQKEKLLASRLDLALRAGSIGVWTYDLVTNQLTWDQRMHELFGISPEAVVGTFSSWQAILAKQDRAFLDEMTNPHRDPATVFERCVRFEDERGEERYIQVWAISELSEIGIVSRLTGVAYEITDRIKVEANLRKANQELEAVTKQKDEFITKISHELRTPLNAILGFGRILLQDPISDEQHNSLTQILRSGEHLLSLINDILDIAKVQSEQKNVDWEYVNLASAVNEVKVLIGPIATESGVTLELDIDAVPGAEPESLNVWGDRQMIKQILFNLISNGVKYNRRGGSVRISFARLNNGRIKVSVKDTGIGIAPQDISKLCKPFERLDSDQNGIRGTGLGLSISRELVELMGGTINIESEYGKGSSFEFCLESFKDQAIPETTQPEVILETVQGIPVHTILIIQPVKQAVFRQVAEDPGLVGLKLSFSDSLDEALRAAKWQEPHLAIVSLDFPNRAALTMIKKLRQSALTKGIKVFATAMEITPEIRAALEGLDVQRCIEGEISNERLREILSEYQSSICASLWEESGLI